MYGLRTWRVYCVTEALHVETEADAEPTECPNDGGHTITPAKTCIVTGKNRPITRVLDELETIDDTQGILQEIEIPDDSTVIVEAAVNAFRTDAADYASYVVRASIRRRSGGGAAIVGGVDPTFTAESDGTWDCTIGVSGTAAQILVTGAIGKTITWSGRCRVR